MQNYYLLVLRNRTKKGDLDYLKQTIEANTPLKLQIDERETDVLLTYKDFGIRGLWGLDGIKAILRRIVPANTYNTVMFLYETTLPTPQIAAWTYPNPLNSIESLVELPVNYSDDEWTRQAMVHEFIHALHRRAWFKGIPTRDTMDNFGTVLGGLSENLKALEPYWAQIAEEPSVIRVMRTLLQLLQKAVGLLSKKPNLIEKWARAIEKYENMDKSYNNPGALRYAPSQVATRNNFAVFETYDDGWKALVRQLTLAANGTSNVYFPNDTLLQFFEKYAPSSDHNNPQAYALFVANYIGVSPNINIRSLLA